MVDEKTRTQISYSAAVVSAAGLLILFGMILLYLTGGGDFGVKTRALSLTFEPLLLGALGVVILGLTADVAPKIVRLVTAGAAAGTGAIFSLFSLLAVLAFLSELGTKERRRQSGLDTAELLGQGLAILGGLAVALVLTGVAGIILARVANVTVGGASAGGGTAAGWTPPAQPDHSGQPQQQGYAPQPQQESYAPQPQQEGYAPQPQQSTQGYETPQTYAPQPQPEAQQPAQGYEAPQAPYTPPAQPGYPPPGPPAGMQQPPAPPAQQQTPTQDWYQQPPSGPNG